MSEILKENRSMMRNKLKYILIAIVVTIVVIGGGVLFVAEFATENTVTAKVQTVNTRIDAQMQVDGLTGSEVTHLISTDKGVFKIQPVGVMASTQFGMIKEGVTYTFTTRGINFPPYRLLPYIIKADSVK